MIIDHCIQGSPEWFEKRIGNPGASSFSQIVTSTGKRSSTRTAFLNTMAGETLLGKKEESYSDSNMQRGTELEPEARVLFEMVTGLDVEEVGLCYRDQLKQFHVSPDGLIKGQNKGLELKCPKLGTHIGYLNKNKLPTTYTCQVQGSLMCTGYDSWYFMSYYPGLKPFLIEVKRDEELISILSNEINKFCVELNLLVKKLK